MSAFAPPLRGDPRPQLGYRIDTLLDLLARVPGACGALAGLIPGAGKLPTRMLVQRKSAQACRKDSAGP